MFVLAGPVSTAGPQGYVSGKDFTAVCSIQTRQPLLKSQYTYHIEMCADLGMCVQDASRCGLFSGFVCFVRNVSKVVIGRFFVFSIFGVRDVLTPHFPEVTCLSKVLFYNIILKYHLKVSFNNTDNVP